MQKIYASSAGITLDSNVYTGGGTDVTAALQAILDTAPSLDHLHLVIDGAALVSGLDIHSNTTIECPNQACGLFLKAQSNRTILRNAHPDHFERHDRNITIIGGTYNQDCKNQLHDVNGQFVDTMDFFGVENLTIRDMTIRNQRMFAMLVSNFFRVNIDNISIDLPDHIDKSNQDGLHFWGPGQFLTIKNAQGRTSDDFIALAPDEFREGASITDVHIDGVFLDNADQGIRMLSRGTGRLDRVFVRNVTGTYRSYGFYLNAWFKGSGGNYGDITIENVNLATMPPNYDYTPAFLFRIGGIIESLTLRNIHSNHPVDGRVFATVGYAFATKTPHLPDVPIESYCRIGSMTFDGIDICETEGDASLLKYIDVICPVDRLTVRNVTFRRGADQPPVGSLVTLSQGARVGTLMVHDITLNRLEHLVKLDGGVADTVQLCNISGKELYGRVMDAPEGAINLVNGSLISVE